MKTHRTRAAAALVGLLAAVARADGPATTAPALIDNPQYALWARYRPGTSATTAADTDALGGGHVHLEVTQTLKSVTPDAVTLTHVNKLTIGGQPRPGGPVTVQTIPAKVPPAAMRQVGTADVRAMGRSFACRVYEASQPGANAATNGTAYLNDNVPGGVVKLVVPVSKAVALTFVLAATDVK